MDVTPHFKPTGKTVSAARGEPIFVDHCALCHGLHGRGDGPRSAFFQPGVQFIPDFATPGYLNGRDEQLLQSVREGLSRLPEPAILMPQFKYILADDEIRSVLAYLKTLAVMGVSSFSVQ
ncbi:MULTISPECIES: c-type cytochrome [unclassified Acidovorax]|uniref:c-type cytochrome n=1 Tax=unclassified Acidovorax TaxID=2684926 RepID=UPI0012FBBE41|nr:MULTISPECIES: cytochrome c [unclassified Acidovorax]